MSQHTSYAWKAKFGGMEANEAQKLRALEDKNGRPKRLVTDLSLDREMLTEIPGFFTPVDLRCPESHAYLRRCRS